ncbi:hypothetical protein QUB47_25340 [Microcoleus sp. AT9_B5]
MSLNYKADARGRPIGFLTRFFANSPLIARRNQIDERQSSISPIAR